MNDTTELTRPVKQSWQSQPTREGAGVHLRRAFGFHEVPVFDPFLLMDDFRSDNPADFLAGFPWHPHRGIETITYVLDGDVEHEDSLGNGGVISSGDIQWMTAGGGILHQEMPKGSKEGRMYGFQLWANLPASQKMTAPKYRDVRHDSVPVVRTPEGAEVRVVAGKVGDVEGPVRDVAIDPEYLDVTLKPHSRFERKLPRGHTAFAYVLDGKGAFEPGGKVEPRDTLVLFGDGDRVSVSTGADPARFLLISGKPLREPVAWYGPIVMNTKAELVQAFQEFEKGTFVKGGKK